MVKVLPLLDCFALLVVPSISLRHCSFCKLLRSLGPREQVFPLQLYLAYKIREHYRAGYHRNLKNKTK